MQNKQALLNPESSYHIYNRANGSEQLFVSNENYRYFLKKYETYINPVANTFCYCLMPNHFHFLLRIKTEEELSSTFPKFETLEKLSLLLSKQFSNFFSSYTQAFNKQQSRKGSLFMKNFKRKLITDEGYFRKVMHYIHYNPVKAGLALSPKDWKYSSYRTIISNRETKLQREEAISYFNDLNNFKYCHKIPPEITGIN